MEAVLYNQRVEKAFRKLSAGLRNDMVRILQLMEKEGTWNLGMPHVRPISGTPLHEIRLHDATGIARAIFVSLQPKELVVLHVFVKKTQATPKKEIDLALQRLKEARHGKK